MIKKKNYKNKLSIMKYSEIYDIWTKFITSKKYSHYFQTPIEKWHSHFNKLKEYIDLNKKMPVQRSTNINIVKIANWLADQKKNYKKRIYIMKNKNIYDNWTEFITSPNYILYF